MAEIDPRLLGWLTKLNDELTARDSMTRKLDRYHAGYPDVPEHVAQIKAEPEYRVLLRQAVTNWPELIVASRQERLEVTGFDFGSRSADDAAWDLWQRNGLDADSAMVHEAALVAGRSYVIVWAGPNDTVEIVPEHAGTTIVAYSMPSGRERAAALRRWHDGNRWCATLYLPNGIYKFEAADEGQTLPAADTWEKREVPSEPWPLENPLNVVPVVEFSANRTLNPYRSRPLQTSWEPRLQSREFGYTARGEFEGVIPIIDRINTTIFNGLLAMAWSSFPVRALIGDPIRREPKTDSEGNVVTDDAGEPVMEAVAPFQVAINRLIQIENPDGKLVQLPEANLKNFIDFGESHIRHLAAITKTPAHYLLGQMVNISADAIRAAEAALISTVRGSHHVTFGEGWEEVMRLAAAVAGESELAGVADARTQWRDPESRSMSERADAALKLKDILPWQALAEKVLQATPQEVNRWAAERSSDGLAGLLAAAAQPAAQQ